MLRSDTSRGEHDLKAIVCAGKIRPIALIWMKTCIFWKQNLNHYKTWLFGFQNIAIYDIHRFNQLYKWTISTPSTTFIEINKIPENHLNLAFKKWTVQIALRFFWNMSTLVLCYKQTEEVKSIDGLTVYNSLKTYHYKLKNCKNTVWRNLKLFITLDENPNNSCYTFLHLNVDHQISRLYFFVYFGKLRTKLWISSNKIWNKSCNSIWTI